MIKVKIFLKLNDGNLPGIMLIDVYMPEMDGFETSKELDNSHPNLKKVALSTNNDYKSVFKNNKFWCS
jgi:two-component system, NtrC family, nitrogen regulation response regulator NtrX